MHERTVGKQLASLGFRRLSARPQHPKSDPDARRLLKKLRRRGRSSLAGNSPQQAPEARVGQQGTLTRIWAERGTRPRAPRDTRYIWSYIFGAVCPERAEAALIMPHADTQAMSAHLAEIAKTVASGAHALLILDGAGWHGSAELEVPDNITLLKLPATRWKMCGLICVPTSSPYPSSTIMSEVDRCCEAGTSLQTTKPQSRQSLPDNRSTTPLV